MRRVEGERWVMLRFTNLRRDEMGDDAWGNVGLRFAAPNLRVR